MANKKFSQFADGQQIKVSDEIVGLRSGINTRFDFPGDGFKDASGNYLLKYSSPGPAAVNYLSITNSTTGQPVIISSGGTDANPDITINPGGTGNVHIPTNVDQVTRLDVDNIRIDGNTIISTDADGSISVVPNGIGDLILDALKWPQADGTSGQVVATNGAGQLSFETVSTFSGVSTDNALARYDGIAGALQNSVAILSDAGALSGLTQLDVDNLELNGNTISSTNVNGNIIVTPNGIGLIKLSNNYWPLADGTSGQAIVTNGAGTLSFVDINNFAGPSTDNAVARFDGTGGDLQNSGVIISDANAVSGITSLDVDNININGNTISTTNANGSMDMDLNGSGTWTINGTVGVVGIINDNTMATATADNLTTALAIKTYVDAIATGFAVQGNCVAATTVDVNAIYVNGAAGVGATLTNAGALAAFTIDGITPTINQRLLIKNQTSGLENGIYTITTLGTGAVAWILTRATDYDSPSEITPGDFVIVTSGTTQAQSSWLQTATVTTVGVDTITFSQFSASIPVSMANGGTGASLVADNGAIFYSTASSGALLASTATARQMLQSGSSSAPAWSTTTWPATSTINRILYSSSASVIGEIAAANGGVLVSGATGVPSMLANPTATGRVLQSVSGDASAWSTAAYPITSGTSGTLLQSNGTNIVNTTATYPGTAASTGVILRADGTNWVATTSTFADTYSISTILYASSANVVSGLATANNAILTTNSSGVPSWTAGTFAITWSGIAGTSQSAAVNNGYVVQNASQTTVTLPTTAALGSVVKVQGLGAGGFILAAGAGQTIQMGASATSVAGSLTSANKYDTVEVVCIVANTTWSVSYALTSGFTIA